MQNIIIAVQENADIVPHKTAASSDPLCRALEKAKVSLLELQLLIEYNLVKPTGAVSRTAWLRLEKKVVTLQQKVRRAREDIWGAMNLQIL